MWLCYVSRNSQNVPSSPPSALPKKVKGEMWSFWKHNLMLFYVKVLFKNKQTAHQWKKRSASKIVVIRGKSPLFEKRFLFYRFSRLLMFYYHLCNLHMCTLCLRTQKNSFGFIHVFLHENINLCRNDFKSKYNISSVKIQYCFRISQNSLFVIDAESLVEESRSS